MNNAPVLLVTNDVIGPNMAGPGIRFWEFARVLSQGGHDPQVASPGKACVDPALHHHHPWTSGQNLPNILPGGGVVHHENGRFQDRPRLHGAHTGDGIFGLIPV